MMEGEEDEELERESVEAGIEPTISELEVEGANQCATLSQTKLWERNGTQCLRCTEIPTYIPFQRPFDFKEFVHRSLLPG